jgi:glycerophosphoryl diester phosphodiesterase
VLWRGDPARLLRAAPVATRANRVPALDPAVWQAAYTPMAYVAHAMGGIDGDLYTNSLEAFRRSYDAGFRVFEVDLLTLGDGTILAAHDGTEGALGLRRSFRETTYAEVRGRRYRGKYTVLTGHDVLDLARRHRDVYFVLDTKWDREEIAARLLVAASGDPQVARRLLPHVAGQADLDAVRRAYPLQHYVVALYRTQSYGRFDDDEVVAFVRRNGAPAVMMWFRPRDRAQSLAANGRKGRRFEAPFADALRAAGAVTYVHSTADREVMREFALRGIGVYSDGPLGPSLVPAAVPLSDPTGGRGA